jgi:hypothetical protein
MSDMWTVPAGEPLFRHCAATALLTLPPAALLTRFAAGTAIDTGDTAWLLAASALVLLMAPGLALFYGGMVRSKSVLNMMMMTFGALAAITVIGSSSATRSPSATTSAADWSVTRCSTSGCSRWSPRARTPG